MDNQEAYERGWRAAVNAAAKMLRTEAEACMGDIVPGDEIGAKQANARAGALLTAEADALEMANKIAMPQQDFIDVTGGPDEEIAQIKRETFERLRTARQLWIIEERGAEFIVHQWTGAEWKNGAGVGPPTGYPTLRKAAARLLQLLGTGAVAPQTWPEDIGIGNVTLAEGA